MNDLDKKGRVGSCDIFPLLCQCFDSDCVLLQSGAWCQCN